MSIMHYALCAFVEYPASALLSEEQEHGVKERGGGGEEGGEEEEGGGVIARYLSDVGYRGRNVTLSSYQVDI